MGLVSVSDLDARQVEYADAAQAQAAIEDVSSVARAYVAPVLDVVEEPDAPAAVVAVVVGMVRRMLTNPRGLQMETLGDYSYQVGSSSMQPTLAERRLLRQAASAYARENGMEVPSWGVGSAYMQVDLPGSLGC